MFGTNKINFTCDTYSGEFLLTQEYMLSDSYKEGNVLFNDALNIFYLRLYGVGHMIKDHSDSEGRKWVFLTTHSTHFIYGYMASDI